MDLKTVSTTLKHNRANLQEYGVKSLFIFGSFARGESTIESDVDMLVEFNRSVGLFEFIRLKLYLEELTGRPVDLVTTDALRPTMRDNILREAVHVT